jgi:hypothetical protein
MASGGSLPVASMMSRKLRAVYDTVHSSLFGLSAGLKYFKGDSIQRRLDKSPRVSTLTYAASVSFSADQSLNINKLMSLDERRQHLY